MAVAASGARKLIALTGATGFIGQHLLRELPKRGYRLRVLLRRPAAMPMTCASVMIGDLSRPHNLSEALADADAVIHSAGAPHAVSGVPADDYRLLDAEATLNLARAAERAKVKRFVFLSSIRAQAGAAADSVLTEAAEPNPTDAYGRAKLAAERGLAATKLDFAALRLALVYGPGAQGNMARLIELARSPYPLPFGSFSNRRSLLALDNLVEAIDAVLLAPSPLRRPLIVADPEPVSLAEMIAALRRGLGRAPALLPVPKPLLKAALNAAGKGFLYQLMAGSLVADTSALAALGWKPPVADTRAALAAMMREWTQGAAR